jgi:hypothetical protein
VLVCPKFFLYATALDELLEPAQGQPDGFPVVNPHTQRHSSSFQKGRPLPTTGLGLEPGKCIWKAPAALPGAKANIAAKNNSQDLAMFKYNCAGSGRIVKFSTGRLDNPGKMFGGDSRSGHKTGAAGDLKCVR